MFNVKHQVGQKIQLRKLYTSDEIDLFYTCFEGKSYLIPISEIEGKTKFRMRYKYPLSGQKQGVHLEKDYELKVQIEKIKEEVVE